MSWLERLQTLVRGEVWRGEEQAEVQVNEGILRQFVSQGFPENAARVRPQAHGTSPTPHAALCRVHWCPDMEGQHQCQACWPGVVDHGRCSPCGRL
jgi:hypothetical protein